MKTTLGLFTISLALLGSKAASPPVKVSLRSSWPAPPLLIEVLETVSLENPDAFFPFLDALTDPETFISPQTMTPEAVHQAALQTAVTHGFLSEPGSLAAVEMNLALHAATPKIEAFYHHYADRQGDRNHSIPQHANCESWVDWYGEVVCDVETLVHLAGIETIDPANKVALNSDFARPKILTFDHIYPPPSRTLERPPRTAIFYGSLTSPNFRELHSYLLSRAYKAVPHIEYVFRHIPSGTQDSSARNYLSGYGVALDLKKTDYLAVDDRHSHNTGSNKEESSEDEIASHPQVDHILSLLHAYPEMPDAPDAASPLTEDELLQIGLQAAQIIADSSEPLHTLTQLSQNFPKYTTSLARRVVVNQSLDEEIQQNQIKAQGGINAMWLNGATLSEKDVNPFGLLRHLRKERATMQSLTSLDMTRAQALDLLTHPLIGSAQAGQSVVDGILDASDRLEGEEVIVWWNNLEKDQRYARWARSLRSLLLPLFPGQFHEIRLNIFNIVLVLDLSQTTSLRFIAGPVSNIIERDLPFRFGVVPIAETEEGTKMARLFYYLIKNYGRKATMLFFKRVSQFHLPPQELRLTVNWDIIRSEFATLLAADTPEEQIEDDGEAEATIPVNLDAILNGEDLEEGAASPLDKVHAYVERLGATLRASSHGHAFVNGKHFDMDDLFLRNLQMEIGQQLTYLQERYYEGKLSDDSLDEIETYFYDLPTSGQRRNPYIYPTPGTLRIFSLPDIFSRTEFRVNPSTFVYPSDSEVIPLSLYVIADLDTDAGLNLMKEALDSITSASLTRISFIHNPTNASTDATTKRPRTSWLISHLVSTNLLSKASPARLLRALGFEPPAVPTDSTQIPLSQEGPLEELTGGVTLAGFNADSYAKYVETSRLVVRELQLAPGQQALLVNGRIVGPMKDGDFVAADFKSLETYEFRKRAEPVAGALATVVPSSTVFDRASFAHLISMSSSVIASIQLPDPSEVGVFDAPLRPRQRNYRMLDGNLTMFSFGDSSTALYHFGVIVDPLSEMAQKWSSLLEWISHVPDTYVEVHINPARYKELPLKRFYRYNLLPSLSFDEDGLEVPAQATFQNLPVEPIYTLAMDVPASWLVRPREALYDLDNIQLGSLFSEDLSVDAVFDLDYLVVEGHARDTHTSAPPRGVQMQLTHIDSSPLDDTQVVANFGYLQFKAKPGVFRLEIREGRGRDIFKMESVGNEGWDSPTVEAVGDEITLTSFEGLILYPRLVRIRGMETVDVLADPNKSGESGGVLDDITSRVMSFFKPKQPSDELVPTNDQAEINIFTVASGLLYERFASIMILSVLRNTKSTVKFWFIENFLSPSFLEFIPHFAEEYGFKYELVTYKWPTWLRPQKEKQRIIWAYKILFLDVLFPMDLKKVIFVDADQIVRADLKELVDLNLHGAPYGYTPMGDDNTDMEGFRFWKTGYWKDFLKGRPYYISALYVVDLVRFRQIAAGDILRGQYQQLSMDPNSLANLDQDLPNNLQQEVPIFPLHEDWLWCETWCSKDRLHRAKTIDLCQNPLTKEPKLARARQIPEWEEYDAEISRFARKLAQDGVLHSRVAAADTNVLANAGAARTDTTSTESPDQNAERTKSEETKEGEDGADQVRDEL